MISGAWWPVEQMPSVIKGIAEALPFLHAMDACRDVVTRGAGFTGILPDLYWLIGWTIALFALGIVLFRRSMAR
jgi:ABC-2 type transport system permease protein